MSMRHINYAMLIDPFHLQCDLINVVFLFYSFLVITVEKLNVIN